MVKIKNPFKKKIGLALGGGVAKGFAHIGALKILEENNIIPDMIAGTSMGALIGAAYALNPNAKEIEKITKEFKIQNYIDLKFSKYGFVRGQKIENFLRKIYQNKNFNQTKIPLYVNASDIITKQEIIFSKGDITQAVRASISIPGIFTPVINNKRILVDGGIINNLPTEILKKKGVDIIITINPIESPIDEPIENEIAKKGTETIKTPNILQTISTSIQLAQSNIHEIESAKKNSDIFIQIRTPKIKRHHFYKQDEIIQEGEKEMQKYISKIKKLQKKRFL
jgi:NTE family protein